MSSWPENYLESWTLASSVVRSGVGLHSGEFAKVSLSPSKASGFYVSWSGYDQPPIALEINQVRESHLCTSLQIGDRRLSTVEHLLAALAGCGLTHINIEVTGEEIPLLDGSAFEWVEAIKEAGIVKVKDAIRKKICLENPLIIHRGSSVISAIPSEKFKLIGIIDFPYKAIGRQMLEIDLTPDLFVNQIASARTFGFKDQLEKLQDLGLIKGGGLNNALVCDGDHWLNPPLRFDDEPIRHKILDLIGDLSLVGFPKAQILVYKGSHGLHTDLASELLKSSIKNKPSID